MEHTSWARQWKSDAHGLFLCCLKSPLSSLRLLIGLGDSDWGGPPPQGLRLTLLYGKCQKINAGPCNKVELDLICPRPPRLICTPFSRAAHVLSKEKSVQHVQDVMLFCRIIIWRHSGVKPFSYVAWHYENVRSCIHTFIHIISLLNLFFFFFLFLINFQ